MTATITSVTGATGIFASGRAQQRHIVYAPNSGVWWAFWVDPASTTTLRSAYSSDLVTWTAGATVSLPNALMGGNEGSGDQTADGRNLGVICVANGSTDVVHVAAVLTITTSSSYAVYDIRATVTASAITWGTPVNAWASTQVWSPDGTAPALAADGSYLINTCAPRFTGHGSGNPTGLYNGTVDTSSSWTPGTWTHYEIEVASSTTSSHAAHGLASGSVLWLWDNGVNSGSATNVRWAKADAGGSTPTPADVFTSTVTVDDNDWGSARVSDTDVHCIRRTGSNTYEHRRFNGTSWSNGQSIPTQTSKAGGGLAMLSDGTDVYLAVIDSAAGNAVRYIKWSGGSATWGTWQDLDATSDSTRASLAAGSRVSGSPSALPVLWTENPSGTTYNLRVAPITLTTTLSGSANVGAFGGGLTATGSTLLPGAASAGAETGGLTATGSTLLPGAGSAGAFAGGLTATGSTLLPGAASAGAETGGLTATATVLLPGSANVGGLAGGLTATGTTLLPGSANAGAFAGGVSATANDLNPAAPGTLTLTDASKASLTLADASLSSLTISDARVAALTLADARG
jgi:hypothetical protein